MPTFYGAIDLVQNELRNARVQNLGSAPATPVTGQLWYDSSAQVLKWWNGTTWIPAMSGGSLTPATTVVAETTFGTPAAPVVGTSANYAREDHSHGSPAHTAAQHSTFPISTFAPSQSPGIDMNTWPIANLPLTPTNPADAASKQYVDSVAQGLSWKDSCRVATTGNIALSGGPTSIDGVTLANNDRVLVKNQTTPAQNGIYITTGGGTFTRSPDTQPGASMVGAACFVEEGTTQADTAWICTTNAPITLGTTAITFVQFGAGQTYVAGNGLTLTGNVLDVGAGTGITVAADSVAVDSTVVALKSDLTTLPHKYAAALTGTASPETVTHNLNTRDVQVQVLDPSYNAVFVDWTALTANAIQVRYNPNLGANFRVVVLG